jgi:pimeloyl-ACP methyl ester carboxylesterase
VVFVNTTYTNPLKTSILPRLSQALRFPVLEPMMWLTIWLAPLAWLGAWHSYINGSTHFANRFGFGKFVTRSQLNHTALLSTRNSQGVIAKGNLAMFRWDASGATATLPVPVLVLAGDMDILTKPEASRTIASVTPAAELQIVEGVNHCGFLERADIYNAAIENFATGVQPTNLVMPSPKPNL